MTINTVTPESHIVRLMHLQLYSWFTTVTTTTAATTTKTSTAILTTVAATSVIWQQLLLIRLCCVSRDSLSLPMLSLIYIILPSSRHCIPLTSVFF